MRPVVVSSPRDPHPGGGVVVIDVQAVGGIAAATMWLDSCGVARDQAVLIAALGRDGEDVSVLAGRVHGIMARPEDGDWDGATAPLIAAIEDPDRRDSVPPDEPWGISSAEFEETVRQAAMPHSDPRRRD